MSARASVGSRNRARGPDLLRAAAILLVVPVHMREEAVPAFLMPVRDFGWMGVDLFFVLSGYLIGSQLLRRYAQGLDVSVSGFYVQRAFRILPAYWVVLALYCWVPQIREQPEMRSGWRFLTFTMNLGLDRSAAGAFSHAWSLCVEEYFYLLFPILCIALMRRPSLARTVWTAVAIALFGAAIRGSSWVLSVAPTIGAHDPDAIAVIYDRYIYYPTYARLDGLLVGVVLAGVEAFRPVWWARAMARGYGLALAGMTLTAGAVCLFSGSSVSLAAAVFGFPVLSIGLGLLLASSLAANGPLAQVRVVGASTVAALAYSLYLSHKATMHLDRVLLGSWVPTEGNIAFAVYVGTSFLVASLLYLCVERPFLKLRDRLLPTGSATGPQPERAERMAATTS
jgi:peptidoglycan/LPS O-acetylase OafA/YrhL